MFGSPDDPALRRILAEHEPFGPIFGPAHLEESGVELDSPMLLALLAVARNKACMVSDGAWHKEKRRSVHDPMERVAGLPEDVWEGLTESEQDAALLAHHYGLTLERQHRGMDFTVPSPSGGLLEVKTDLLSDNQAEQCRERNGRLTCLVEVRAEGFYIWKLETFVPRERVSREGRPLKNASPQKARG
jgi:hypothetical protein